MHLGLNDYIRLDLYSIPNVIWQKSISSRKRFQISNSDIFLKFTDWKEHILTSLGLVSRRNDLRSPPANNSKMMNLGCFSKQTPIKWTIFGWLNLDMMRASIRKSNSAWLELSSGKVFTATAISRGSLGVFL